MNVENVCWWKCKTLMQNVVCLFLDFLVLLIPLQASLSNGTAIRTETPWVWFAVNSAVDIEPVLLKKNQLRVHWVEAMLFVWSHNALMTKSKWFVLVPNFLQKLIEFETDSYLNYFSHKPQKKFLHLSLYNLFNLF